MSGAVIFKELPETFPEKDKYKKPSFISAVIFHVVLITVLVAIPLLLPQSIAPHELFVRLVAPPPPPPPPPPPAPLVASQPRPVEPVFRPETPGALIMPVAIPKDVARIVDEDAVLDGGVVGGVPGGVPGGVVGGVLGGILSAKAYLPPPPPPAVQPTPAPPAKPAASVQPVRVGGLVKEPHAVRITNPVYPKLAKLSRITGVVVLEATINTQGTVSEIKVLSGHPLLVQSAIDCLKEWQYEPTLLDGVPTPIILTATIHFNMAPLS